MEKQLLQVAEFHRAIGEKIAASAGLLEASSKADRKLASDLRKLIADAMSEKQGGSHLFQRGLMAVEELAEWLEAHVEGDLAAAADAWGDRMYVLLGDAVATGLPAEQIFDEIHRSNLTKVGADMQTGKGIKSAQFESPKLSGILERRQ